MMVAPKITIIVPVYNTEKYLPRCINSILSQTFTDFELLLIDDGSTDRSYKILEDYAIQDERIRIFHQENGGVTSARNIGVTESRGEWVSFVDSDDELLIDALSILYENVSDNIDVVVSDSSDQQMISADDFVRMTLQAKLYTSLWGRLYRRSCVEHQMDNISRRLTIGEDTVLNIKVGCNLKQDVLLIKRVVYKYYENPNSAMRDRVVSLQYEEYFMSELQMALGERFSEFYHDYCVACLISLETLIVSRVVVPYDSDWVKKLIIWRKSSAYALSLRQWIVLNVRRCVLARYMLAIERRLKKMLVKL